MKSRFHWFILFLLVIVTIISCKSKNPNDDKILFTSKPVYSETDSFGFIKKDDKLFSKSDYYLVTGNFNNKQNVHRAITAFANGKIMNGNRVFKNYIFYFYRESSGLNIKSIGEYYEQSRYKIFQNYKDDNFLASLTFKDSTLTYINWSPKYE